MYRNVKQLCETDNFLLKINRKKVIEYHLNILIDTVDISFDFVVPDVICNIIIEFCYKKKYELQLNNLQIYINYALYYVLPKWKKLGYIVNTILIGYAVLLVLMYMFSFICLILEYQHWLNWYYENYPMYVYESETNIYCKQATNGTPFASFCFLMINSNPYC